MKFLVLVSEDMTSLDVEDALEELARAAEAAGLDGWTVTTTRDWFKQTFGACGNLTSWVWNTVNRLDVETRAPVFDVFVLPEGWKLDRHSCLLGLEVQRVKRPLVTTQGAAFRTVTAIVGGEEAGTWDYIIEERP